MLPNVASTFDFHDLGIDDFTVLFISLRGTLPSSVLKLNDHTDFALPNVNSYVLSSKLYYT